MFSVVLLYNLTVKETTTNFPIQPVGLVRNVCRSGEQFEHSER